MCSKRGVDADAPQRLPWKRRILWSLLTLALVLLTTELLSRATLLLIDLDTEEKPQAEASASDHMSVVLTDGGADVWLPSTRGESFSRKKHADIRLFCVGGSSVFGDKVEREQAFPFLLRKELSSLLPQRKVEVINAGRNGGTLRLVEQVVEIAANCEADVCVLYAGHNEYFHYPFRVLRGETVGTGIPQGALATVRLLRWLARRGFVRRLKARVHTSSGETLGDVIRARREDEQAILQGFESTLDTICRTATLGGVKLVLCTLASNLRSCPPFKSMHGRALSHRLRLAFNADYANGVEGIRRMHDPALPPMGQAEIQETADFFEKARDIDPTYAMLRFHLGECYFALGRYRKAREEFEWARELDSAPRRAKRAANDLIRRLAKKYAFPLFDAESVIAKSAPHGIPGRDLFFDEVHFTPKGHKIVARALAWFLVAHVLDISSPTRLGRDQSVVGEGR